MSGRFSNQVALVTGGTGGLGRAVTLALLHEGAAVIATYIKKDEADALRDALEHVTLSDLNHQMAHHERRHDHELVASIKPAASVAEGVR